MPGGKMIENQNLLKLVETGSPVTSALAFTLLNQRTSGAILSIVSEMIEHSPMKNTGGKIHGE